MEGWTCAFCSGPVMPLGVLGEREHGRCRNCGLDQNRGWSFTPASRSYEEDLEVDGLHYDLAVKFHEDKLLEDEYGNA